MKAVLNESNSIQNRTRRRKIIQRLDREAVGNNTQDEQDDNFRMNLLDSASDAMIKMRTVKNYLVVSGF